MRQLVYTMFVSNNCASFDMGWKGNLVKHQKVSKCYENDCRSSCLEPLPSLHFFGRNMNSTYALFLYVSMYILNLFTCQKNVNKARRQQLIRMSASTVSLALEFFACRMLYFDRYDLNDFSLELLYTFFYGLFLNSIPISFVSFSSSFSCNSMPCSWCSALDGVGVGKTHFTLFILPHFTDFSVRRVTWLMRNFFSQYEWKESKHAHSIGTSVHSSKLILTAKYFLRKEHLQSKPTSWIKFDIEMIIWHACKLLQLVSFHR